MTSRAIKLTARNSRLLASAKPFLTRAQYAELVRRANADGQDAAEAWLAGADRAASDSAAHARGENGYRACACRDCMELAIGGPGAMCHGCDDAGCPGDRECQAADAYGGAEEAAPELTPIHRACLEQGFCVLTEGTTHPGIMVARLLAALLTLAPGIQPKALDAVSAALEPDALDDEQHPAWDRPTTEAAIAMLIKLLNAHAPAGFVLMPEGDWNRLAFVR